MQEDYTKLRPFDLEAAKAGEKICWWNGEVPKYFLVTPGNGVLANFGDTDGEEGLWDSEKFCMAPLCWVRKSVDEDVLWPVYKGDVVWHNCGRATVVGHPTLDGHDVKIKVDDLYTPTNAQARFITFTPPSPKKVKREVKLLAYLDADQMFWLRETAQPKWPAVRAPSEDQIITVEEDEK